MKYGTASKKTGGQQSSRSPCASASAQFAQDLCNKKNTTKKHTKSRFNWHPSPFHWKTHALSMYEQSHKRNKQINERKDE